MNTPHTRHPTETGHTGHVTRFARPDNVVWRLAPDRVLVRRIGDLGDDGCADLIGAAAPVWVGLDEPGSLDELRARLVDAGLEGPDGELTEYVEALHALVERNWIDRIDGCTGTEDDLQSGADHER